MSHKPDLDPEALTLTDADYDRPRELGSPGRTFFTVAWCSFLAASVATMVFFAIVDPAPFAGAPTADGSSRMTLYSLGFFFFWAICFGAAALTAFMLTTPPASPPVMPRAEGTRRSSN
ncbi:MAG: hypothetical protein U1F18_07195 [Steroidobacteraceae bacterium]